MSADAKHSQKEVIDLCSTSSEDEGVVYSGNNAIRPAEKFNARKKRDFTDREFRKRKRHAAVSSAELELQDAARGLWRHPGETVVLDGAPESRTHFSRESITGIKESAAPMKGIQAPHSFVIVCFEGDDDDAVMTDGVAEALCTYFLSVNNSPGKERYLTTCCGANSLSLTCLRHIQQNDKYSCGYRNTQVLLSALSPWIPFDHPYYLMRSGNTSPYQQLSAARNGIFAIPSLRNLQKVLEAAWASGLDPDGAEHYSRKIVDKTKWIGAVEVWSMFAYWKTDACVVQFVKCFESRRVVGHFCSAYFSPLASSPCLLCSQDYTTTKSFVQQLISQAEATSVSKSKPSDHTSHAHCRSCTCPVLPLYLQWHGHSVTVVGVESGRSGIANRLIVLDPLANGNSNLSDWADNNPPSGKGALGTTGRVPVTELHNQDCQILVVSPRRANHVTLNCVTAASSAVSKAILNKREW